MWLPGSASSDWLESVDEAIALGARSPVAVPARGLSERAAQGRNGARALVAGARRRRRGDVPDGDGAAGSAPATSSTRSPTSRGPGRRSRHNLKYWTDGEWLGFGCGAHSTRRRRAVEECRRRPRTTSRGSTRGEPSAVDVRRLTRRRAAGRRALHRPAADRRHRSRRIRRPLRRGCLGSAMAASSSRSSEAACCGDEGAASLADPPRECFLLTR